ncbi:MAG: hypothetical protein NUV75_05800 [Gallionella sp.]|nr:hypothetical protein [Gallionella sp.]
MARQVITRRLVRAARKFHRLRHEAQRIDWDILEDREQYNEAWDREAMMAKLGREIALGKLRNREAR